MATHALLHLLQSLALLAVLSLSAGSSPAATSSYVRPGPREPLPIPLQSNAGGATPQQVRISMAGEKRVRVTWITDDDAPATVDYGKVEGKYGKSSTGSTTVYTFNNYTSGKIHEAVIGPLDPDTVYFYRCRGNPGRRFSFKTPPARLPVRFTIVGDLGQTGWTISTLYHISESISDMLIVPGDLSYANCEEPRWDSFGWLIEPLASRRPWMVTTGNHELEVYCVNLTAQAVAPYQAYNARWHMPYEESGSPSNIFYSFDVAGGAVHFLMLGSFTDFNAGSDQYKWLTADLAKLDRSKTRWLFAVLHAPWYNSNEAHQGCGEKMRLALEDLLYASHVDAIFVGHVHAYERFTSVYDNEENECGAVHITIGDGGNREGLASNFSEPQPSISMFREASFGHGDLFVANETHALWTWHRNDDDEPVVSDSVWIKSFASKHACHVIKKSAIEVNLSSV